MNYQKADVNLLVNHATNTVSSKWEGGSTRQVITTYGLLPSATQVYQQSAIICFTDVDFAMALLKGIVHLSSAGYQILRSWKSLGR